MPDPEGLPPWAFAAAPWEMTPLIPSGDRAVAVFDAAVAADARAWHDRLVRDNLGRHTGHLSALDTSTTAPRGLFGISPNTADVSFDGSLELQVSTTRSRNLACTPAQAQDPTQACHGGFTAPSLNNVVTLHSSGTFLQRFHVNIDFESTRDYSAQNIVSIYYQGLEDEKLQRVDVGTVIFRPPPSRFLSASIPSNNLGISAEAVFGPVTIGAIAATQKGSTVASKTFTIGNGTGAAEPQDQIKRDLDYEQLRAFWIVDPATVPGYPNADILNLGTVKLPANVQPTDVRIYHYVAATQNGANANYEGITARGVNGSEGAGPLRWVLLKPNVDYWIDPTHTWFILQNTISPNDYLAVSYHTQDGGRVGTVPSVDNPAASDTVQLVYLPNRGPASPVFPYEMRQLYRVAGASLVRSSLSASITVANSSRPIAAPGTYLSLLGLAVPANQALLDIDNRVFPRLRDQGAADVIKDAFIVFPSTRPFSDPELTAAERNDSLYVTPEYLLFSQGPPSKFQMELQYDAAGGSTDRSSIMLGASDIAENTDHLTMNGVTLVRGVDYSIDYATGRVDFLNPTALFGNNTVTINASYEERGLFVQAPTSIAGLTATWSLGTNKTINFMGLYQAEATGYTRPQIGYEARASALAGITANMQWDVPGVSRFVSRLVRQPSTAPSLLALTGEVAVSHPDPNRSGDAYLENFENDFSVLVSALQNTWVPGSVPRAVNGLESILPAGFDSADAVQLTWQNLIPNAHDSIAQLTPQQIDPTVALTQTTVTQIEPVLWMALQPDTAGGILRTLPIPFWNQPHRSGSPRWRTITTPLSNTGLDLTNNDYFQFALYEDRSHPIETKNMRIVIDLGHVSEDALSIAPTTYRVLAADSSVVIDGRSYVIFHKGDTVYAGRQYVGVGKLNTEKTSIGTWSATADDNGILADRPDSLINSVTGEVLRFPALCRDSLTATVVAYPWGDLGSRCTVNNGLPDTEDLDGDNILDAQGSNDDVFRYVINLATDSAKYFVRRNNVLSGTDSLAASWTIYRIPLRGATDTIGSPDMHLIKQMRLAFVAPPDNLPSDSAIHFAVAMMKFTGAAWVARSPAPDSTISGQAAQPHGTVTVGSVSTQDADTSGLGYTSPPGIGNAAQTVTLQESQLAEQINETSLRIQVADLHPGERAESYHRLPNGTQNLLAYRTLRVWVRGHGPGWGAAGPLQAYVKVGSDAFNFYLYRQPAQSSTWDPEMVIDLATWQSLRAQIENARLGGAPPNGAAQCGVGDPTAYVACTSDGAYVVQVRDPLINPPNLAAVQELAAGIYYPVNTGSTSSITTELWVDDIRVSDPVSTTGVAGAFTGHLTASDVATFDVAYVGQNGQFHLMSQAPTYQNTNTATTVATLRLDRFLPTSLGLLIPVSYSGSWGWIDPELIAGTDVEAGGIADLRRPRSSASTWTIRISDRVRADESALTRYVLNPLSLAASGTTSGNLQSLSDQESSSWITSATYILNTPRRTRPFWLRRWAQHLPRWLRSTAAGQGLAGASYTLMPSLVQLSSTLTHTSGALTSYQEPIMQLSDTILKPVTSEQYLWRNAEGFTWQPIGMFTVTHLLSSERDLLTYADSTTLGRVENASHREFLGTDVGVERDRMLTNSITVGPRITNWFAPSITVSSEFVLSRSLTSRNPVQVAGDTAGAYILPQTFNNARTTNLRFTFDPHLFVSQLFGDSSALTRALDRFRPVEFNQNHVLQSTYDLATFNPSLAYELALGSFNSFLYRNGEQAIGAATATIRSVAASVDLPGGVTAQANYQTTISNQYDENVGGGFLRSTGVVTSWPSGRFSVSHSFGAGPIATATASSSISRDFNSNTSAVTDGSETIATSETRRISPSAFVLLRNGVSLNISGELDHTEGSTSGDISRVDASSLTGSIQWTMRLPRAISVQRRQVITSLSYTENGDLSCIQRSADSACQTTYQLSRREVDASFSALLQRGIHAGLQIGYVLNAVKSLQQIASTLTLSAVLTVPLSSLGM